MRMTASSTRRSLFVSSSAAISAKLSMTSKQSQVGCDAIEPQPSGGGEGQTISGHSSPAGVHPGTSVLALGLIHFESIRSPQPEIHGLGDPVLSGQFLLTLDRIDSPLEPATPVDVCPDVPA